MQGWLSLWGYSPTGGDAMAWMGGDMAGHAHGRRRHGCSCPAWPPRTSWRTCARCTGTAFDVEFLRLMIRHHEGGLAMAQYAQAHGETDVVRTLAKSIADSQTAETELMTGMLADGAAPRCRRPEALRRATGRG